MTDAERLIEAGWFRNGEGFWDRDGLNSPEGLYDDEAIAVQSAIDAAVKAEREACAVICDALAEKHWDAVKAHKGDVIWNDGASDAAEQAAKAIRERGA